jgi:THO complex subunit 7
MAMNEDEIIRKRLIVEGDSGQDDRRIISLLKTFLKWCFMDSLSQEENEATYQKMVLTLGQV